MEKVLTGSDSRSAMSATMIEESMPPLRKAPSGTSEISLRRPQQSHRRIVPVERLFAHAIPRQQEPFTSLVPQGDSKHAVEATKRVVAPLLVGVNDDLSVAVGGKAVAVLL